MAATPDKAILMDEKGEKASLEINGQSIKAIEEVNFLEQHLIQRFKDEAICKNGERKSKGAKVKATSNLAIRWRQHLGINKTGSQGNPFATRDNV